MLECLESDPDQTSLELLAKTMAKHPDTPHRKQLRTLHRRVKVWRQDAVERLICQMQEATTDVSLTVTVAS